MVVDVAVGVDVPLSSLLVVGVVGGVMFVLVAVGVGVAAVVVVVVVVVVVDVVVVVVVVIVAPITDVCRIATANSHCNLLQQSHS